MQKQQKRKKKERERERERRRRRRNGDASWAARPWPHGLGSAAWVAQPTLTTGPCDPGRAGLGHAGLGHAGGIGVLFLGSISRFFFFLSFFSDEKEAEDA